MTKMTPDIGVDVIEYTFDRLPVESKLRVIEKLQRKTRKERWDPLMTKIRSRVAKHPISQKEIDALCEESRQKFYDKDHKSRR